MEETQESPQELPLQEFPTQETPTSPRVAEPVTEDIDPSVWLSHDDTKVIGYVETRAGRLTIAALSESETEQIRRLSTRPVKGDPRRTEVDLKRLRLSTVALSLNKAYGLTGTAAQITPDQIEASQKLAGEVTNLVNRISELSGYTEERSSSDVSPFLSVS